MHQLPLTLINQLFRTVECTASAIQGLLLFKKLYPEHRTREIDNFIKTAAKYIENVQMPDGSWYVSRFHF